jgi:hypothetical protein
MGGPSIVTAKPYLRNFTMKRFSQFNIKPMNKGFVGEKINIHRIINKPIVVHDFKIEKSKYEKGHGRCLYLQITVDGTMRVVFIGSAALMDLIEQVPREEFPFETTIVKENERFEFT